MGKKFLKNFHNIKSLASEILLIEERKAELREPRWVANLASLRPSVSNAFIVFGCLAAGAFLSNREWWFATICSVIIAFGLILDHLRESRVQVVFQNRQEIEKEAVKDLVHTVIDTLQGTCDALTAGDKKSRDKALAAARRAILSTVRRSIGPDTGVRVNFFEVVPGSPPKLEASSYGHEGRHNHRSARVFTFKDESFKLALQCNTGRFVEDAYSQELTCPPSYQTFATMPVSSEKFLYGMLTIDSPKKGDITDFEAKDLLNLFASELALTFSSEDSREMALEIGHTSQDE